MDKILSVVHFADKKKALTQKQKFSTQENSTFCKKNSAITARPATIERNILMDKWHLIQNQPILKEKENSLQNACESPHVGWVGGWVGTTWNFGWGYFRPKHAIFHTRFQTWLLKVVFAFVA